MRISEDIKQSILDMCNIEDVVQRFHVLTKRGSNYICCCPVHKEKTPSFTVSPSRNTFKCFGCGIGGNSITYLMEVEGMPYVEAVRYLADMYNVRLDDDEQTETAEERNRRVKREAMAAASKNVADFYNRCLHDDTPEARAALKYATERWGVKTVEDERIGYAPGRCALVKWAESQGHSISLLEELGLVKRKDGKAYDAFYDRVVLPIRDRSSRVVGFTARAIAGEPKYINSAESLLYSKGKTLYGLHAAAREAARQETMYLVEGAPDVLQMHSIGAFNTVAPLGTAWTASQFELLRRYNARLCFIPDIDKAADGKEYGAGIAAVIKNGSMAIRLGFTVTVKEIIPDKDAEKADPGSYIRSRKILDAIEEQDFIPWLADKRGRNAENSADRAKIVKEIASLLAAVDDPVQLKMYTKQVSKSLNTPMTFIQSAVNDERARGREQRDAAEKMIDRSLYQKFGFYERNNSYYSMSKDGVEQAWSNFTMRPLFHIKDAANPKRLYEITNEDGHKEIIELKQKELVSLSEFKCRVEGVGNFIWEGSDKELNKLKRFIYAKTDTAAEITQLGWQRDGFYAFGNGVFCDGKWVKADEYGIVKLAGRGNYYLPGASKIFASSRELFQFERRFIHTEMSSVSLRQFTEKLVEVFGDNAKIGMAFLLATLFKDVVTSVTKSFPILNLFGPKGSGKSELGHSLMSFFIIKSDPANISTATQASLADIVAQCANALVHLDEYKNTIELERREFIKGLWDGVGRSRMNMDRDKKREMTRVDSGIILSGQEMPTIDIAIFSRMLFCTFSSTKFSWEEKAKFNELAEMRDLGCSHLTLEILKHRKKFEAEFSDNYRCALDDMQSSIGGEGVEDRIFRNWVVPLAAFRTLMGVLDLPFDYKNMLDISACAAVMQNKHCQHNNEVGRFWSDIDYLHQSGSILMDTDYKIRRIKQFKGRGMSEPMEWKEPKAVLYLSTKRAFMLYKQNAKNVGDAKVSTDSLRFLLEHSKEYIGTANSVRFRCMANPSESVRQVTDSFGQKRAVQATRVDWALCFDYREIAEKYGVNLDVDADDGIDIDDIDTDDKETPF